MQDQLYQNTDYVWYVCWGIIYHTWTIMDYLLFLSILDTCHLNETSEPTSEIFLLCSAYIAVTKINYKANSW